MTKVVKIFLASPGDLEAERQTVRDRADHFNRMWSDEFQVHFRVVGWEDLPPVAQRPQGRINRDADDCHLFVGLMWMRWGTTTGKHSSGFEEEFLSARQRWKETNVPEIALFFKSIEASRLADPGAQLAKVLDFKKSITEGKELLYKEFSTLAQLADYVDGVFAEYAKSRRNSDSSQAETSFEQRAARAPGASQDEISIEDGSIDRVLSVAHAAEVGTSAQRLDFWGRLRLWLHATAQFGESRSHLTIGVHEASLVYRMRSWKLSPAERGALTKSMLSDPYHYTAGWVWLAENGLEATRQRLWYFCLADGDSRKGAAALLAVDDRITGSTEQIRLLLTDEVVTPSLCRLLGRCGTMEYLSVLAEVRARADERQKRDLIKAEFEIIRRHGPVMTLEAAYKYVNDGVKEALSVLLPMLLAKGEAVSHSSLSVISDEKFRATAAEEIFSAKQMSESLASDLLADPSPAVRAVAVKALVALGRTFSRTQIADMFPENSRATMLNSLMGGVDVGDLITVGLRNVNVDELKAMVEFFSIDGKSAFQVLALYHWDIYASEVAKQLDEEFEPLVQEGERKALSMGYSLIEAWNKAGANLVDFVRERFLGVALEAVAHHGHPSAINWVQRYIAPERPVSIRIGALRLQLSLGVAPDYASLVLSLGDFPADLIEQLIPGLLSSLNPEIKVIEAIAKVASSNGRKLLRQSLSSADHMQWRGVLSDCLHSGTEKARQVAALALCDVSSETDLLATLASYVSEGTYFYDVVSIFDWHIYGLEPYRAAIGDVTSFG